MLAPISSKGDGSNVVQGTKRSKSFGNYPNACNSK